MSDELKVFAAPVLRGGRFDDHTIPIDVLPQFVTYRDLVRDLAKELFRRRNERIRVPARFDEAFQLKLQKVEGDCAVPVFARASSSERGEDAAAGPDVGTTGDYYDEARELITATIDALARNKPIPEAFPTEFLEDLNKLGGYLREDEALEFRGPSRTAGPVFDAWARLQLRTRVAKKTYTKPTELSGTVIGFDWETEYFRFRTLDGDNVVGRHTASNAQMLLQALKEKKFTRVRVTGDVQFTHDHIPQKISGITRVELWSGSDEATVRRVEERLQEFTTLPRGWLDGEGVPVPADEVPWLATRLTLLMVEHELPEPTLFAVGDGGVQAIWRSPPWRVEGEFNLIDKSVSLIAISVESDDDDDADFDLTSAGQGREFIAFLKKYLQRATGGES